MSKYFASYKEPSTSRRWKSVPNQGDRPALSLGPCTTNCLLSILTLLSG